MEAPRCEKCKTGPLGVFMKHYGWFRYQGCRFKQFRCPRCGETTLVMWIR